MTISEKIEIFNSFDFLIDIEYINTIHYHNPNFKTYAFKYTIGPHGYIGFLLRVDLETGCHFCYDGWVGNDVSFLSALYHSNKNDYDANFNKIIWYLDIL